MKYLSTIELILLNKYVQSVVEKDAVYDWFLSFQEGDRQSIVARVWDLARQSQAVESDVLIAAKSAGLKPTHTPIVMLIKSRDPFHLRGYNLSSQRGIILEQAFKIVLECFALAERRRKDKEDGGACHHWWHRDLSDEAIVREIIKSNGA